MDSTTDQREPQPAPVDATRYSISQAAELLGVKEHTLRQREKNPNYPAELFPARDGNGHRYWTPVLVERIKQWTDSNDFAPGRGLRREATRDPDRVEALRDLRRLIVEAVELLDVTPGAIVRKLPEVAAERSIELPDALRTAADALRETTVAQPPIRQHAS